MRYLLLIAWLLTSPAHANDPPEQVRAALAHVMFAYFCPTNDDQTSIELAQLALDNARFDEVRADEAFDTLLAEQPEVSDMSRAMGCSMVQRIESNHPFK